MRKFIGKILIIVGILIISTVVYTNYYVLKNNKNIINEYENSIKEIDNKEENKEILKDVVCILDIPKIDIKVAVKEGTGDEVLKNSVGHFQDTALPGEKGNFAVAGHRAYYTNKFFSNLNKIDIGDEIKTTTKDKEYTYKVISMDIVEPDSVEVIQKLDDKKEITLITCTPKYIGTHRLIVKGVCID